MPRKPSAANAPKKSSSNVRRLIGANIKARRLTLGWSQQELADRFGVSRAAVSQYEIGTGEVNAGDVPRLAEILGVGVMDFFGNTPPISPPPNSGAGGVVHLKPFSAGIKEGITEWIPLQDFPALTGPGATKIAVVYMLNHGDRTAVHIGEVRDPAESDAIIRLLGSILILSPYYRETLRRVVEAMLGGFSSSSDMSASDMPNYEKVSGNMDKPGSDNPSSAA